MSQNTLEKLTLQSLINRSVKEFANEKALGIVGKETYTYQELGQKIEETIKLLRSYGIKPGDKVAILSENLPNWGVAYFAISSMGAVIVPILVDFHGNEIRHILHHSECKAAFVSDRLIDNIYEDEKSQLDLVININRLEVVEDLTEAKPLEDFDNSPFDTKEDDLAVLIYTSGTTGHSKGVMLSNKNIVSNVTMSRSITTLSKDDVVLSILPLPHVFECSIGFLIPLIYGSQIQYIEKPPTPKILVDALGKVRPTFMVSVPLIIEEEIFKNKIYPNLTKNIALRTAYKVPMIRKKLHKVAGKKLIETFGGRLHFFGIGGAKISAQVEAFLDEADFPYTIGYGLTETSPLLSGTVAQYRRLRSAGTMLHGLEYRINENKELVVKGPNIMMGYYKDEERTKEVLEDGWFNTGDLGVIDQDGYLFIEGRSKNVIVGPSGENIYPEQIESKLNDYEFVLESVVYLDSNRLQARVHLDYEKLDEKFNTDNVPDSQVEQKIQELLEEIRIDLNESVSSFSKIMKFIEQREPFVKTATKKIKRYLYTEN